MVIKRILIYIFLHNREIVDGKQVDLRYDDKMYIIFENGETEIEVRYKRVSNKNLVQYDR